MPSLVFQGIGYLPDSDFWDSLVATRSSLIQPLATASVDLSPSAEASRNLQFTENSFLSTASHIVCSPCKHFPYPFFQPWTGGGRARGTMMGCNGRTCALCFAGPGLATSIVFYKESFSEQTSQPLPLVPFTFLPQRQINSMHFFFFLKDLAPHSNSFRMKTCDPPGLTIFFAHCLPHYLAQPNSLSVRSSTTNWLLLPPPWPFPRIILTHSLPGPDLFARAHAFTLQYLLPSWECHLCLSSYLLSLPKSIWKTTWSQDSYGREKGCGRRKDSKGLITQGPNKFCLSQGLLIISICEKVPLSKLKMIQALVLIFVSFFP